MLSPQLTLSKTMNYLSLCLWECSEKPSWSKSALLNKRECGIKREVTHCEDVRNITCALSLRVSGEGYIWPVLMTLVLTKEIRDGSGLFCFTGSSFAQHACLALILVKDRNGWFADMSFGSVCVCVRVCACVRACARTRACVCVCACACVRVR